ncbi:MAG TPA: flippase [Acetobacteraceae bacterium]|nr:flippase [Acetobacteraceae bacterium]
MADSAGESRLVAFNAVVRGGGEVFAKLASVVFYLAVARELGATQFGDLMFALSFTTVITLPSGFGTEELIAREVARDREKVHEYAANVMAIKVALTVVLLGVAEAIVILGGYSTEVQLAVLVVGASVGIENLGRTWGAVLQAYQRMEYISVSLIVQRVVTAVAGVIVLLLGGQLLAVSIVMLVSAVIGFAVITVLMDRRVVHILPRLDRSRWIGLLKAGIPVGMVGVLMTALFKVDQTLISFLAEGGNREVGFYGAAFRLIEATMFIGWSFSAAMLPWFSAQAGSRERIAQGFELGTKATAAVLVPVGLTFILFAEPLIELLYGSGYGPAVTPLRFLGAGVVFLGINNLAASLMIARDRPLAFAAVGGAALVGNVALNIVLIPEYGADGAAFTAALSAFCVFIAGFFLIRSLAGRVRLVRSIAGPFAAGGAASLIVLFAGLPVIPAALAGAVAYALVFVSFEHLAFPDDLRTFRRLADRRGGGVPAETAEAVEVMREREGS